MTLKTSFFNKGIYKSTVKRYAWGSVLYFLVLFLSSTLTVILNVDRDYFDGMGVYYRDNPMILETTHMIFPILAAIVVPTIVALLIFRFVHSKKQAIFIHSLPVSRKANYNSSMIAAFTLMGAPVLLNGLILAVMSLCGLKHFYTVTDSLIWIGYNFAGLFMMFSCAVFAASITGNGFAMIAINIIIHAFLPIIVSTFSIMAECFVYGFTEINESLEILVQNNFAYVVFGFADEYFREKISVTNGIIYFISSAILYVASYFLYKKRRIETASDVAGFNCLNIIFKYIVTFGVTMFAFAVFAEFLDNNPLVFSVIIAIISLVAYTACEMVLKKTLKVLYSWKGYLGFAAVFGIIIVIFSQTSFFGYETRIPQDNDIEKAAIYNYYYCDDEPYISDREIIDMIRKEHSSFVNDNDIPKVKAETDYHHYKDTRIHIKYKLKNGKTVARVYPVKVDKCTDIMNRFYENTAFKKSSEQVFMDDDRIVRMFVNNRDNPIENHSELLDALRTDYMELSYGEIYHYENYPQKYENSNELYSLNIEYTSFDYPNTSKSETAVRLYHINVTGKFKNTVNWLKENGYEKIN